MVHDPGYFPSGSTLHSRRFLSLLNIIGLSALINRLNIFSMLIINILDIVAECHIEPVILLIICLESICLEDTNGFLIVDMNLEVCSMELSYSYIKKLEWELLTSELLNYLKCVNPYLIGTDINWDKRSKLLLPEVHTSSELLCILINLLELVVFFLIFIKRIIIHMNAIHRLQWDWFFWIFLIVSSEISSDWFESWVDIIIFGRFE